MSVMETDRSDRRILLFERRNPRPLTSPFVRADHGPVRTLNARQLAHRRRMLEHLQSRSTPREAAS